MDKKLLEKTGQVVEVLPNGEFKVKLDDSEHIITGHLSGKMRQNRIKVILGDRVKLEIPSDIQIKNTKARITYRTK